MASLARKIEYAEVPFDIAGSQPSSGRILKHRYTAQQMLRRPLKPGEVVVVKDGNFENITFKNIMIFASRKCSRRWNSQYKEEFLFQHDDGVYDYDWKKIDEIKSKKLEDSSKKREDKIIILEKIKDYISSHKYPTIKEASQEIEENYTVIYNLIRKYNLESKFVIRESISSSKEILKMPRKELIELALKYKTNKNLAEYFNVSIGVMASVLFRRGISRTKPSKFKYLNKKDLQDAAESGMKIKEICQLFDTFEENVTVNLRLYNIDFASSSFAFKEEYEMPEDSDFENDKPDAFKSLEELEKTESNIDVIEGEVEEDEEEDDTVIDQSFFNKPEENYDDIFSQPLGFSDIHETNVQDDQVIHEETEQVKQIEHTSKTFKVLDACQKYDLSLCDISYLTGKYIDELVKDENVDLYENEIVELSALKKVMTKENALMLLANHSKKEIAQFYNCSIMTLEHVLNHI